MTTNDTTTTDNAETTVANDVDETTTTDTTTTDTTVPEPAEENRADREAAKYRRQLRDTEKERDTLASRLEALQRAEAERIAASKIDKGASLWASGVSLPDLLDADGNVDQDKVTAAAETAREALGLKAPLRGPMLPNVGRTPEDNPNFKHARTTWADAIGRG